MSEKELKGENALREQLEDLMSGEGQDPDEIASALFSSGYRLVKDKTVYVVHCEENDEDSGERDHWIKGVYTDIEKAAMLEQELIDADAFFFHVATDPIDLNIEEE